jgi:lactoylglutathione lyase
MRSEAMAIREIHHVALTVSDLEKSTAFYKNVLGFRKILDMPPGGPALQRMLKLRPGTTSRAVILQQGLSTVGQIELIAFDPPADKRSGPKRPGDPGVFLLAFEVTGEELVEVYQRLQAQGIECTAEPQTFTLQGYGAIQTVVFEDPDGVMIELMQLPLADEIRRMREAYRAERRQPTA